ncbi:MAG TPA: hypothetical protein PLE99_07485 [Candidatus Thiothrix moscowensis]|uniref:hypothetical protein n=2 Tax=unclassified Thiothrix TaxID=2636184 RepID=UPI0025E3C577|nr:hypothetical protein [Thiothrix sp. UBA5583]HRJ52592.1 hypothetical protein [Candidatus Thiothrix moscowensis]HRJ94264.1 hypothetical protein [Candidatus Thiothrix moscowensis]
MPESLEPLFQELLKIKRGFGEPYSPYLALVLLDRAVAMPQIFMNYGKTARSTGLRLVDTLIDSLEPQAEREDCPSSVLQRLEDLRSVRGVFLTQAGETTGDFKADFKKKGIDFPL